MNDIAAKLRLRPSELIILCCAIALGGAAVAGAYAFRPADDSTIVTASSPLPADAPTTTVPVQTTEPAVEIPATTTAPTTTAAPTTTTVAPTTTTMPPTTTTVPPTTTTAAPTTTLPPTTTTAAPTYTVPGVEGELRHHAEATVLESGNRVTIADGCDSFTKPLACTPLCAHGVESTRSVVYRQTPAAGSTFPEPQQVHLTVVEEQTCMPEPTPDPEVVAACAQLKPTIDQWRAAVSVIGGSAVPGAAAEAVEWYEANCEG